MTANKTIYSLKNHEKMKTLNLTRLKTSIPFSYSLNGFIQSEYSKLQNEHGIEFTFVDGQPYDNYEQMKQDFIATKSIKISKDYSDTSIFGDKTVNWMFRAVHDMQHIELNKDFSHESEFYITHKMLAEYRKAGLSQLDIDLLTIEMNGQICYHLDNNGQFPDNQRAFTIVELKNLGYKVI